MLQGIGERPSAAYVRGANVNLMRYIYTGIGGALVGVGGALYSLSVKTWNGQLSGFDGIGWIISGDHNLWRLASDQGSFGFLPVCALAIYGHRFTTVDAEC